MKVLGVIPSRFNSSRFPGKPLIDLKGKSMIQRVYEGALKCPEINLLIVATDDDRIFDHVVSFGGNAMMTKNTHVSGTERCEEIAGHFPEMDVIVNIQGDEPLVNPTQLSQLIKLFNDPNTEIGTLATSITNAEDLENPNRIKLIVNKKNEALCFSRNKVPSMIYTSNFTPMKHIGLYGYRRDTLHEISKLPVCEWEKSESLEQLRWLYNGYKIQVAFTEIETPNIDTPEDVRKVIALL